MKKKPGVMIYFTMRPLLKRLSNENKGLLFDAILEYADTGNVPQLPDALYVVWPLIQANLLYDEIRYRNVVVKRKYAAYVRWARTQDQPVIDFPAWAKEKGYTIDDLDEEDIDA